MEETKGVQKVIETFVDGFIGFTYNVAVTLSLLLFAPVSNSVKLTRLSKAGKGHQVASTTILFVVSAVVVAVAFSSRILKLFAEKPDKNALYTYIGGVISLYVIVDLCSQLISSFLVKAPKQSLPLHMVRYTAKAGEPPSRANDDPILRGME